MSNIRMLKDGLAICEERSSRIRVEVSGDGTYVMLSLEMVDIRLSYAEAHHLSELLAREALQAKTNLMLRGK
jgi:hypothetical protein